MRITGSLFTYAELSASVADNTFVKKPSGTLYNTNECVTVGVATDTVYLDTIFGSTQRYPFYDELIPSGSTPPPTGSVQTLTYSYVNNASPGTSTYTFDLVINGSVVDSRSTEFGEVTISVNVGDEITAYFSLVDNPPYDCAAGYYPELTVYKNGLLQGVSLACPFAAEGPYTVSANDVWVITAIGQTP